MSFFKTSYIGKQALTSISASSSLTIPTGAVAAYLQARLQDVYITFDASTPSAVNGLKLRADDPPFFYEGYLNDIRVIESVASGAVHVVYVAT